jgi:probable rRNA maturation factor
MLEVEVLGRELLREPLSLAQVRHLCALAMSCAGIEDGHLAVEFVGPERIAELNERHRGKAGPTDVLSFPIDGADPIDPARPHHGAHRDEGPHEDEGPHGGGVPRELGDIVICPQHTADLREAIVHGALHLIGMDHETDDGEMLALQAELLRWSTA